MTEQLRRADDMRIEKIESNVEKMQDDIVYIKTRIDNGFSTSIKSTENKVQYIDEQNNEAHKSLKDDIRLLSGKFDKLLWALVSVSFLLIVGEGLRMVLI